MLSRRSLAFISASAIRRARALFSAALHRSPDRISISGRKRAAKIATNMAMAAFMSVSYEQVTPFTAPRFLRLLPPDLPYREAIEVVCEYDWA